MTRMAGDRLQMVFSNDSAVYGPSVVGDIRRSDDATAHEELRANRRARYGLRGYDREKPRVKKPELEPTTLMNERRDATIAARKQKEEQAKEDARQKALWS